MLIGNYAFIPLFTILVMETRGFLMGLFLGLSIQNHFLSIFLAIFSRQQKFGSFILGLFFGSIPMLIFNLFNFVKYGSIPTIEDLMVRPKLTPPKIFPEILRYDILFVPFLIIFLAQVIASKNIKIIFSVILLLFMQEERYFMYVWSILIWTVSKNFSNSKIGRLPLLSMFYFASNVPSPNIDLSYTMYPYGKRHFFRENDIIEKNISCVENFIRNTDIIAGDIVSTNFIKFFYPWKNIYYYIGFSYVIPIEFKQDTKSVVIFKSSEFRDIPWERMYVLHSRNKNKLKTDA
ncbi:MAG: hypothetical protein RMJ45_04215 [Candidatus Calescibacterium sp.]|nr:hypothetical protein [Candidatus Calescibacterium sp.]